MRCAPIGFALAAALVCPSLLLAQGDTNWVRRTHVTPGALVRVEVGHLVTRAPESQVTRSYLGHVTAIGHDTLVVATTDSSLVVPRILITHLELSLGQDRAFFAGQYGFCGAFIGYLGGHVGQPRGWRQDRASLIGTGIGFLAGYAIGFAFPQQRWALGWLSP
jgi:hypothetical protein